MRIEALNQVNRCDIKNGMESRTSAIIPLSSFLQGYADTETL